MQLGPGLFYEEKEAGRMRQKREGREVVGRGEGKDVENK